MKKKERTSWHGEETESAKRYLPEAFFGGS